MKIVWDAAGKVSAKAVPLKPKARKLGTTKTSKVAEAIKKQGKKTAGARAGRGFTAAEVNEVMDFPELSDAELASAKPFAEVFPELASSIKRRGKQVAPTKIKINLRVDQAVLDHYKQTGPGWQVRMNDALKEAAGL